MIIWNIGKNKHLICKWNDWFNYIYNEWVKSQKNFVCDVKEIYLKLGLKKCHESWSVTVKAILADQS